MIGHRVYGPLMRLEIKVNPIPHVGSGRNVPPYQEIVVWLVFFPQPNPLLRYRFALL